VGAWGLLAGALLQVAARYASGALPFHHFLSADALYLPALYRDLLEEGGRWNGWALTPAPYFFPDLPLLFSLQALLGGAVTPAVVAYAAAQWLLFALALLWVQRAVSGGGRGAALVVAGAAGLLLLHAAGRLELLTLALLSAHHFGAALLGLSGLALLLRVLEGGGAGARVGLAAVCALGAMSDRLFLVLFAAPAAGLVVLRAALRREGLRPLRLPLALLVVGSAVGLRAGRLLTRRQPGGPPSPSFDWGEAQRSAAALAQATRALLEGPSGPVLLAWAGVWLLLGGLAVGRLRWAAGEGAPARAWAVCTFFVLSLGTSLLVMVGTGNVIDAGSLRYLPLATLPPLLLPAVLGAALLAPGPRRLLSLLALALVAGALALTGVPRAPLADVADLAGRVPPLARCLDAHAREGGLVWGIGGYWEAKPVSLFSREGVRVRQVDHTGAPFTWISNSDWFLETRGEPPPRYTFALQLGEGPLPVLEARYGLPERTLRCEGFTVWVYGPDFDAKVRAGFRAALRRP
jgi:hypothetical protein